MTDSFEKLMRNNPEIDIWEYLNEHPDQVESLLNIEAYELFELIENAILLEENSRSNENNNKLKSRKIKEHQVLISLLHYKKIFAVDILKIIFDLDDLEIGLIFEFWLPFLIRSEQIGATNMVSHYHGVVHQTVIANSSNQQIITGDIKIGSGDIKIGSGFQTGGVVQFNDDSSVVGLSNTYLSNPEIPVSDNQEPLPHHGLFIRRNNQFGTRLSVGIKDLIEQGVLIDQTNIRFDDFVVPNSDQIPSPTDDSAIAVSYGLAPIPLSQKRDSRATHYLEIALKASDTAPTNQLKRQAPPVNYVFVVDTSGSMSGEKLDSVKESIRELFKSMKPDDVIGIIEFNTSVNTVLKASIKNNIDENSISEAVSSLHAEGGTDINLGLQYGIDEIGRYGHQNRLNHVYLFSDGDPTSGETDWIKIRQNVDSKTRGKIRLSTFAFGSDVTDVNKRELDALAGLTGGKSTFVTEVEDIKANLQEELNRREYLAGMNVQAKVNIDPDISILYFYGHDEIKDPARRAAVLRDAEQTKEKAQEEFGVKSAPDLITEEDGIRLFVPDLAVGETYWIVLELGLPENQNFDAVGQAIVQYVDIFTRTNRTQKIDLTPSGVIEPELVVQHALGLWSSEVAFYTLDDLYEKDYKTATDRITEHVKLLRAANNDLESDFIADDIVVFNKFMSLSQNLGKTLLASEPTRGFHSASFDGIHSGVMPAGVMFTCALNKYGRVMNGFNRISS